MGRCGEIRSVTAGLILSLMSCLSSAAHAEDTASSEDLEIRAALNLAKSERFDTALDTLSKLNTNVQNSYACRFAKARILTWAQRYQDAEIEYEYLMARYPDNPDVKVSYGYLDLFRGNFDDAEVHFTAVIERHPEYEDAHRGLRRASLSRRNMS